MESLNCLSFSFHLNNQNDLNVDFVQGFFRLIPYLNKTKTLLHITLNLQLVRLTKNTFSFIDCLLNNLKNAVSYSFCFNFTNENYNENYKGIVSFIYYLRNLKKRKILNNLYSIEIIYQRIHQLFNLNDVKEILSDLLLGYPKFILLNNKKY